MDERILALADEFLAALRDIANALEGIDASLSSIAEIIERYEPDPEGIEHE